MRRIICDTAYWYAIPLIAEVSTAWSTFENWYPVMTILLCLGWILCIPIWYYQVRMSEGMVYGTQAHRKYYLVFGGLVVCHGWPD